MLFQSCLGRWQWISAFAWSKTGPTNLLWPAQLELKNSPSQGAFCSFSTLLACLVLLNIATCADVVMSDAYWLHSISSWQSEETAATNQNPAKRKSSVCLWSRSDTKPSWASKATVATDISIETCMGNVSQLNCHLVLATAALYALPSCLLLLDPIWWPQQSSKHSLAFNSSQALTQFTPRCRCCAAAAAGTCCSETALPWGCMQGY